MSCDDPIFVWYGCWKLVVSLRATILFGLLVFGCVATEDGEDITNKHITGVSTQLC